MDIMPSETNAVKSVITVTCAVSLKSITVLHKLDNRPEYQIQVFQLVTVKF